MILTAHAHAFTVTIIWTGNTGLGTQSYRSYKRHHDITTLGKPIIPASSDPAFRGDPARYNPEELVVAALSSCHMLWLLHLAWVASLVVVSYQDIAEGVMNEQPDDGGAFTEVVLCPEIVFAPDTNLAQAEALRAQAHAKCFIANSVSFPIRHEPLHRHDKAAA